MASTTPYTAVQGRAILLKGNHVNVQLAKSYSPPDVKDSLSTPLATAKEEGPKRERRCQDAFWAVLFYAHLGAMVYCTAAYAPQLMADFAQNWNDSQVGDDAVRRRLLWGRFLQDNADENGSNQADNSTNQVDISVDPKALLTVIVVGSVVSLVLSTCALGFMMAFAETLVKIALFFNIFLFTVLTLTSFVVGAFAMGIAFLLVTLFVSYYTYRVWTRIPFAAANLVTAVTAVKANLGLAFYSYLSIFILFLWSFWWTIASMSTIYVEAGCNAYGNCDQEVNGGLVFAMLLSYYWTVQVIANVVHCSVAGTVGTWWYAPHEANGCCSKGVRDAYSRSITLNFGSICFASLVVALIQTIREMVHSMRDNGDGFCICIAECLLACIESLVELFNRFALVYCAVHGQSFLQAGRSVMDLFRARGWTSIITDMMVDTVLSMMSVGVGLLIALLSVIIGATFQVNGATLGTVLVLGFILGYAICAVLLSVVSSAVNTVIVCFAEAPNEFQQNHPQLSIQMRDAWRQAWPHDFSY